MSESADQLKGALDLDGAALMRDEDGGPRLVGSECGECGQRVFPPTEVCPECMGEAMRPLALSRAGTLYSFSVVHAAPKGWTLPFIAGYVDLPEGVRVFAHIVEAEPRGLALDSPVELCVAALGADEEGTALRGFAFRPAGRGGA